MLAPARWHIGAAPATGQAIRPSLAGRNSGLAGASVACECPPPRYRLMARAIQPKNSYRHQWQLGDLVIWDNRSISHIAYRDYDHKERRIMQRVILAGDTPV